MKKALVSFLIACNALFALAQESEVLFWLDDQAISTEEFEKVYTKNNINNQADYSEESLTEYLDLFINFKLKVTEAEALQMDTIPSIKNELNTYKRQLAKSYANNKEVSEELLLEAYDRSQLEVDASHLLILWPNSYPSAADSAKVKKEILAIKKQLTPANFAQQAALKSQDPSAKDNKGRLGYLTVFQTVYPFENALYSTEKGKISDPVATQFGYHLVLVHDVRPARGKIKTAHILVKSKASDAADKRKEAEEKIRAVYEQLKNGELDFAEAAKKFSEDNKTKFQGGKLPELSSAEMIVQFADAAFGLEKDGDYSSPVLTEIGWHIIQRISKSEISTLEEAESMLTNKIARDSRSNVAQAMTNEDTKVQFGFSKDKNAVENVVRKLAGSYDSGSFMLQASDEDNKLFSIGNESYSASDFIAYVKKTLRNVQNIANLPALVKSNYDAFESAQLQQYREENLAEVNEDYRDLMQEYHDGILLFELTDKEVWSKAVMDTAGLKAFHEKNKMKYMWPERVAYTSYVFRDEKSAAKGMKFVDKAWSSAKLVEKMNKKEQVVKAESFKVLKESFDAQGAEIVKGNKVLQQRDDEQVEYWVIDELLEPMPKELAETRGYVISDYQSYLEKEWIASLKQKYTVKVNKEVFNSLIR